MKVDTFLKSSFFVLLFVCFSILLKAQGPGDGGIDPDPGMNAPLDLGISALVAAGIGYAAKRRYDARKKDKHTQNSQK